MQIAIQIDKIAIAADKVKRQWAVQEDGTLVWRKEARVTWKIEQHNKVVAPAKSSRPMLTKEDRIFHPHEHSVTLDDFVLLRDRYVYCHIATGLTFTARQINRHIFKDKASWPLRVGDFNRMNPAAWIRKYNRVEDSRRFNMVRGAFNVAA